MRSIPSIVAVAGLTLAVGCASSNPIPRELASARDAYNRALAGPGNALAPAQIHTAKVALDKAEKAFDEKPSSKDARDLAYIAERKAQLAEAQAGILLAEQQKAHAEKTLQEAQASAQQATQAELERTREQLAKAELQTKDALSKVGGLEKDSVKQDERGLVITLSGNVLFAPGKSTLLPAARQQLDEIARALVGAKAENIRVEGFTDSTGSSALNEQLSQARAESVTNYLASKGLSSDNIQALGRGPSSPVASNTTREGRASNRRVEIIVQGQAAARR
ncbi:MAG TPA: OmpA family protein [Myxococcota bacterium]|nr:OmpA family protein [Myxococcota bacterium]